MSGIRDWYYAQLPRGDPNARVRSALVLDDAPIGQATVWATGTTTGPTFDGWTTSSLVAYNRPYPTYPMHYRIRVPLYGNATTIPADWQNPTWILAAFLVRDWWFFQSGGYTYSYISSGEELENRDLNDGDGGASRITFLDAGFTFTPYGARMARTPNANLMQIVGTGHPNSGQPNVLTVNHLKSDYGITIGGSSKQFPHAIAILDEPTTLPFMWEVELAFTDSQPRETAGTYYSEIYLVSCIRYEQNGQTYYGGYTYAPITDLLIRVSAEKSTEPAPITSTRCIHNLSEKNLLVTNTNQLQRRSLFSFNATAQPRTYPSNYTIIRVREIPRRKASVVLLRSGTSAPYNFSIHVEDADATQEVVAVTGNSAMIEVAATSGVALLILQNTSNEVYAYQSYNGGWSWEAAQRCQLGGSDMSASQIHDLDFSIRRNVFMMTATIGGSVKLLISEDGVNWTDTGV